MAAEREPTPEKQLLNLIEEPKPSSIQQAAIKRGGFSLFSLGAFKGRFSFFKKNIKSLLSLKREPSDIKRINRLLMFCVFILAAYFITSFTISALNSGKSSLRLSLKTEVSERDITAEVFSPLKKISYYLEEVRTRDIFNPLPYTMKSTASGKGRLRGPSKIDKARKNLKLVGIGVSPQGELDAIIEDVKNKKVYFLKRGQKIEGLKVEAIFKDSVVLTYEEKELILK